MIARSSAEYRIGEALKRAGASRADARHAAARLVDEIYGVLGADAENPERRIGEGLIADDE